MEVKGFAHLLLLFGVIWLLSKSGAAEAAGTTVFTLHNNCTQTVWPATLSGNSAAAAVVGGGGGFELSPNATVSFPAPAGWSGRLWARTGCVSSGASSSSLACATGDCNGAASCTLGGAPPVTLAEFTLGGADGKDFYDVSLVDGYNVGIGVAATGDRVNYATCEYAGCVGDVNALCPPELQMPAAGTGGNAGAGTGGRRVEAPASTVACRSACEAFGTPEYCCTGAHGGPVSCGPTDYSRLFKAACPAAYSYAYDDPTSTFTCGAGAQYLITFCPAQQ